VRDLGSLSALWPLLGGDEELFRSGEPAAAVRERLRATLAPPPAGAAPVDVRVERTWERDDVAGTALSWDVGFGPRTRAWLLRPAGETRDLPGVVALHCHGGVKAIGKEKLADGPDGRHPAAVSVRKALYGGTAWADELARRGYAVLVHDVFGWGSRRVPVTEMPARSEHVAALELERRRAAGDVLTTDDEYDVHAGPHEDAVAKLLGVLGTSWGGVVVREDLIAVDVLTRAPGVAAGGVAVLGLSGGGARAATATALGDQRVRAAGVVAMMSTMPAVLDGYLHGHTWMMMNPGLGRVADWPDIAAAARPRPLFVGYALGDALFPEAGMHAAHERIGSLYADAGHADRYTGAMAPVPHSFDGELRRAAWDWLDAVMR
jgi:dienelactone hydrolase